MKIWMALMPRAPGKQELAFGLVNLLGAAVFWTGWCRSGFVAPSEEELGVPRRLQFPIDGESGEDSGRLIVEGSEDGVRSDAAVPIAGVPGIGLDAMSDGMPIAAFGRPNVLGGCVTKVPMTGEKEEAADGGFGIARVGEEFGGIGREKIWREFLGLKFAGGERDRFVGRFPEHTLVSRVKLAIWFRSKNTWRPFTSRTQWKRRSTII